MEFPEYATKYSPASRESRKTIPAEHRTILEEIEYELSENPFGNPERVSPVSLDGKTVVYIHPSTNIQITYHVDTTEKIIHFTHFVAPTLKVREVIFISYSHQDKDWLAKIKMFLSVLEQSGRIKFWDDLELEAGRPWEEQIQEQLNNATAGVLLVSQQFLNSKFIQTKELTNLLDAAKKEGKKIFWVPLSPSTVFQSHKEITKYQSLKQDPETSLEELSESEQKKVFVQITKALGDAVSLH